GEESAVGPLPQIRSVEPGRCAQPRPLLRLSLRFLGALAGRRGFEGKEARVSVHGWQPFIACGSRTARHAVTRSRLRNPIAASPTSTAAAARNTSVAGADRSSAGYCPICV